MNFDPKTLDAAISFVEYPPIHPGANLLHGLITII